MVAKLAANAAANNETKLELSEAAYDIHQPVEC